EIVELTSGKKAGQREGKIVSTYEAAQRQRRRRPVISREHGADRRFVMSLAINETVRLRFEDGTVPLYPVQKMDVNGTILCRPVTFAGKMTDRDKPPLIIRRTANSLQAKKVTVDPLGRIRDAHD